MIAALIITALIFGVIVGICFAGWAINRAVARAIGKGLGL